VNPVGARRVEDPIPLPFTVGVAFSVLRSVPVQPHSPMDEHWHFRLPTWALHHFAA
jgi:hypothetical protein